VVLCRIGPILLLGSFFLFFHLSCRVFSSLAQVNQAFHSHDRVGDIRDVSLALDGSLSQCVFPTLHALARDMQVHAAGYEKAVS
jgi:hypothetical protein